jgi:hypothetical protein
MVRVSVLNDALVSYREAWIVKQGARGADNTGDDGASAWLGQSKRCRS